MENQTGNTGFSKCGKPLAPVFRPLRQSIPAQTTFNVENLAYSPSEIVENEENPGIARFFRWKTTRKTVKHALEKRFPAVGKSFFRKAHKTALTWYFPFFSTVFQLKIDIPPRLSRKAYKTSSFSVLSPLFSSKSNCFSRFSALLSAHFHGFPHSLNKKWKTRKT